MENKYRSAMTPERAQALLLEQGITVPLNKAVIILNSTFVYSECGNQRWKK